MDKIQEELIISKAYESLPINSGSYFDYFSDGYKSANLLPTEKVCPDCTDGYNRNPDWKVGDSGHYEWTCTTCNGTQIIPLYYTTKQYEKIMGKPFFDDALVWIQIDNKKKWVTFRYDTAKNMYNDLPCYIVQTNQPAPPADYRPEE